MFLLSREVIQNWPLEITTEKFIETGVSCHNWLITTTHGEKFVVRLAGKFHQYVDFQVDLMKHLLRKQFPYEIPQPMITHKGDQVVHTEQGAYYAYPLIEGQTSQGFPLTEDFLQGVGRLTAKYDNAVRDMPWEGRGQLRRRLAFDGKTHTQFASTIQILRQKDNHDEVEDLFLRLTDDIARAYSDFTKPNFIQEYESLPKIPCHGDISAQNVIVRKGEIRGLVDFGGICIESRMFDLQSALDNFCAPTGEMNYDLAQYVLKGYLSEASISETELKLIPMVMFHDVFTSVLWIIQEREKDDSRIADSQALQRLNLLEWLSVNKSDFELFCLQFVSH